jgi:hypothetical protein
MKTLKKAQEGEIFGKIPGLAEFLRNKQVSAKDNIVPTQTFTEGPKMGKQSFWDSPVNLNWQHILQSQIIQGGLSALSNASPNSYQNATLRFNQQFDPTQTLPQNPNYSNQDYYGNKQDGGQIVDSFIKDFLSFNDEPPTMKGDPVVAAKKSTEDGRVSEADVEQVVYEEEQRKRVSSADRIAKLLQGLQEPTTTSGTSTEIKSSGKYGAEKIGPYGQKIAQDISNALGYAPTFNSIYRDPAQQDALIAQGKPAVKNSWHLTGDAVDMKPNDWNNLTPEKQSYFKTNYDVVYHDNHYHIEPKGKRKQMGGLVNSTGYTPGSGTEFNPMNIIPTGNITMQDVPKNILAVPFKNNKAQMPVMMDPKTDYAFDADYTMEFAMGGEYDVTPEQLEMLKKLGYDVSIS